MTEDVGNVSIRLIGHPFAPIGRGEDVRCTYRAFRSIAIKPTITDVYNLNSPDSDELKEFANVCVKEPSEINIFFLNGDEVERSLAHLGVTELADGYNIVYPAWELSRYPKNWAEQLDRFDEIWAMSSFVKMPLEKACKKPVIHMPLACEVTLASLLSRRYFGIDETHFVFLFFFDVRSYVTRKNPKAVIAGFRRLLGARLNKSIRLVLKVNGADNAPEAIRQLHAEIEDIADYVSVFHEMMTDNEVKNLVRCCDCFVSLHRSEGFGRGIAETMALGKPVIATGYSGNMEYMNKEVSFPIAYELIPLSEGEYPHWENQVWADADVGEAVHYMSRLIDDPALGQMVGRKASLHMRQHFRYSAMGINYRKRLECVNRRCKAR